MKILIELNGIFLTAPESLGLSKILSPSRIGQSIPCRALGWTTPSNSGILKEYRKGERAVIVYRFEIMKTEIVQKIFDSCRIETVSFAA